MWKIYYTKQAQKDAKKIKDKGLSKQVKKLLRIIETNPFDKTIRFEKLVGDLKGAYSRRINIKHRLIYQVLENDKQVKILRMWTHYE